MKLGDVLAYLFLAVTWGFSFLVLLEVTRAFGWVGAVTFRAFVASTTLLAVAAVTGRKLDFGAGWRPLVVVGATTVAGQLIGLSFATPRIGTATTAILVAAIPLFSMIIGKLWGIECITPRSLVGLVFGFVGIVLLVGFPAVPVTGSFVLGCVSALLGSFSAAFGSSYASRHLRAVGSWEVTIGSFLSGGLLTLPLLLAVPVPTPPRPVDYMHLLLLGSVMSALNYVLYFRLVSTIGATRTISVEFAVTIVAVLAGALLLREPLSAVQIIGAVIVVSGCTLVLGLVPWKARPRARA
ncbi:DMT family transporter [Benzoatithermus flavus]|uniref:DMT family transporter n=1 Tax=Benzoatithermus flavus TaxID=3108223 RepID=A0ABU8XRG4_9PROT